MNTRIRYSLLALLATLPACEGKQQAKKDGTKSPATTQDQTTSDELPPYNTSGDGASSGTTPEPTTGDEFSGGGSGSGSSDGSNDHSDSSEFACDSSVKKVKPGQSVKLYWTNTDDEELSFSVSDDLGDVEAAGTRGARYTAPNSFDEPATVKITAEFGSKSAVCKVKLVDDSGVSSDPEDDPEVDPEDDTAIGGDDDGSSTGSNEGVCDGLTGAKKKKCLKKEKKADKKANKKK